LTCKKAAEIAANLIRRHLTIAQRTLIVREILLPEAEAEAKTRLEEGRRRGGAEHALAPTGAQANRAPKHVAVCSVRVIVTLGGARDVAWPPGGFLPRVAVRPATGRNNYG